MDIKNRIFSNTGEVFVTHSLAQFGIDILSIRQVKHGKPPFYTSSTKRFSSNGL